MEKDASNVATWIVFLVIATCVGFSRLPGAEASSSVQERCSAASGCNETECFSGTVICLDNKCTCLEVLGGSALAPEIAQSPEPGQCMTSRDCEEEVFCYGGRVICINGKCRCCDRKQVSKSCSVVHDCKGYYCSYGRLRCIDHQCICIDDPYSPRPSPSPSPSS